jgi:enoyl-CoA hydratase/carnithine racemase
MAQRRGMFAGSPAELSSNYRRQIQLVPRAFDSCEVPLVAAVNGPAIGAGCDLALMCDIRVASEKAFFAETFVNLGMIPGDGGAWLLPRLVGPSRATLMMVTGRRVPADQALEWGLVDEVVQSGNLLPTAHGIAAEIAARPPQAVRLTKRLLRQAEASSLDSVLELSATLQALSHHTQDHLEALSAFAEQRPGRFLGR